jgi:hypothetical protein
MFQNGAFIHGCQSSDHCDDGRRCALIDDVFYTEQYRLKFSHSVINHISPINHEYKL